ncbi:MAG: malonyl CoA-ACP transacylase [Hyphomicrobium sp.]
MLALLCGGQGRLSADMFALTADHPAAVPIFAAASRLVGTDPRQLVESADAERLSANRTSQLLSVTAVLAAHAAIADKLPQRFAVTGYSVGEMAAWSIAGVWSAEEALILTDHRARAMDIADGGEGHLAYVRGLDRKALSELASRHGCAIAIIDPGNLFVVGGALPDVTRLCRAAEAAGAVRAALLDVKVASHTPRLTAAVAPFLEGPEAGNRGRTGGGSPADSRWRRGPASSARQARSTGSPSRPRRR